MTIALLSALHRLSTTSQVAVKFPRKYDYHSFPLSVALPMQWNFGLVDFDCPKIFCGFPACVPFRPENIDNRMLKVATLQWFVTF